ncbi:MAG: hypothetical protein FVQ82_12925 [Planctomycetes bacterium]|nr:hypothetical protein [Planctomycetota bacterium]
MANPKHVEKLRQGVKAWNKWRKENPDITPDLSRAKLIGADLRKVNLSGVNLSGVNLSNSDLSGANFGKANLSGADLSGADLSTADLIDASLIFANLLGACLSGVDLSRADIFKANLSGVDLFGVDLRKANLSYTNLQGANFQEAIVDGSTLLVECEIDKDTNFSIVGLGDMRIDSGTRQLLEYNIRRKNWNDWSDRQPPWIRWLVKGFWWANNYGSSTKQIIKIFLILAFIFAFIYYAWGAFDLYALDIREDPGIIKNLFFLDGEPNAVQGFILPARSVYFSIVTMTTLGFGDMFANVSNRADGSYAAFRSIAGHFMLTVQVLLGYVILGLLVTRLGVLFNSTGPMGKFTEMDDETKAKLKEIKKKKSAKSAKSVVK